MKSDVARRIERQDMDEWERQYRNLLGPMVHTPDCTCDWVELTALGGIAVAETRTRPDENCSDHN